MKIIYHNNEEGEFLMKYENFDDFFSNLGSDNNEMMLRWKKIKEKRCKSNFVVLIIMIFIVSIVYLKFYDSISYLLGILCIIPIVFVFCIVYFISLDILGNKDVSVFNKDYKEKIINKLLENFIEELDYDPLKKLSSNIYDEAQYGRKYNRFHSDDYFEGKINGKKIVMADLLVELETGTGDDYSCDKVFNGLFGKIELDKSINSNIRIIRENRLFISKKGKIEMDSYEFEKKFNVYADNNIIAMQLLTPDVQEDILELYNKYKINFYISIIQNKMYFLFNTGRMFEVNADRILLNDVSLIRKIPRDPNEALEKYFDIMKFIYKLVYKITKTIDDAKI